MAKILHLDIETAPIQAYTWTLFKPMLSHDNIVQDWYMLCYAAKWHGEESVYYDALWLNKDEYKVDKTDDYPLLASLHQLLDEADVVVAHNAQRFDVAKVNAKFYEHGFNPPSPYKIVDTLLTIRKKFRLTSNRLDYVSKLKAFGQKLDTDFQLWIDVMAGNKKQCARMLEYNIQDVILLEDVYTSLLPWITNHPNVNLFDDALDELRCPRCGSIHVRKHSTRQTITAGAYTRYQCMDCGTWGRGRSNLLEADRRKNIISNIV